MKIFITLIFFISTSLDAIEFKNCDEDSKNCEKEISLALDCEQLTKKCSFENTPNEHEHEHEHECHFGHVHTTILEKRIFIKMLTTEKYSTIYPEYVLISPRNFLREIIRPPIFS